MVRHALRYCSLLLPLWLAACGGGGGGGGSGSAPAGFELSGTLSLASTAALDGDTNDLLQPDRAPNNDIAQAQLLRTPVALLGTLNVAGAGPLGANYASGDEWDIFLLQLTSGQSVELSFSGSVSGTDIDLYLVDAATLDVVGFSASASSSVECITPSAAGDYYLAAHAYSGAARYALRIGAAGEPASCSNLAGSSALFVSNQLVGKPRDKHSPGLRVASSARRQPPALLTVPDRAALRAAGQRPFSQRDRSGLTRSGGRDSVLEKGLNTLIHAKRLRGGGDYAFVEPNFLYAAHSFAPNDPRYSDQRWHYELIGLPAAATRLAALSPAPTLRPLVAVIDDGIVRDHPDLAAQVVDEYSFISKSTPGDSNTGSADDPSLPADDPVWHGTHVAGTVAAIADNSVWGLGVAPQAQLMPLRVFDGKNASLYDVLQAIYYAAGLSNNSGRIAPRRADVINLSLGGTASCPAAYADAFAEARAQGVVVVASSGNEGASVVSTPANCPGVVAVGAVNASATKASYSNAGSALDVMAPGGDSANLVYSTLGRFVGSNRQPWFGGMGGTSMAAPHVAGVIALMRYANPAITPADVDTLLALGRITSDLGSAGWDADHGYGLIDADKAVSEALTLASSPDPLPGVLVASPAELYFGSLLDSASFTVSATASTTESVSRIDSSHPAVSVSPTANVDGAGLGDYLASVDRSQLPLGYSEITLSLQTTLRTLRVSVRVIRFADTGSVLASHGRVRVFALDPADDAILASADVLPQAGSYVWLLTNVPAGEIRLVASTDVDNNGIYCEAGEACGAWQDGAVLPVEAARSGLDFSLPLGP